jgi:hypothetical protein
VPTSNIINANEVPLVGKYLSKYNAGRDEISRIVNTEQGVRHLAFLVEDDEIIADENTNFSPEF